MKKTVPLMFAVIFLAFVTDIMRAFELNETSFYQYWIVFYAVFGLVSIALVYRTTHREMKTLDEKVEEIKEGEKEDA